MCPRGFPALTFFQKCEIGNSSLIHYFHPLRAILSRLIILQTYTQLDPGVLDYDVLLVGWTQI